MRSSLPPPLSASSGFFRPLESRMITRALPLQSISVGSSSHVGSASGVVSIHSLPTTGPALSFTATAPTLQLQIPLSATSRIAESTPPSESMDCEEDAYAPLIKMTSPTEVQPSRPDFVMGEGGGLYPVADLVHMGKEPNTESLGGEVAKHGIVDVRTDGSSYQGASGSGYVAGNTSAKDEKGKSKAEDDSEDGLGGDPPPFDESDPLWEELLAYTAGPDGNGLGFSSCVDAAGLNEVATSTSQHVGVAQNFGGDPTRAQTSFDLNTSWDSNELSWDFSDVLNSGADNPPHPSESQSDVWKELCAWADEQPPEMLESVFGMLDTSESFVAEEPSVEPVGLGDFPFFEESPSLELPVAIITVESPTQPLPSPTEYNPHPQVAQDAIYSEEKRHMYPSSLEASATFTLDELDWDVMEEYAQLEDLECPDNSVDAARVMVVAIRAVADKAKTAFVDRTSRSEGGVFLPPGVIDFPAGYPAIVGGQSISPSYQYVSLLDEDVQEPVDSYYHHQTYPQPTSLPHVLAAS
ncbi:hypothetical protein BC629DRAFT_1543919 [Irpex lacteus]|nr:hypothetical protein BC629DRAFT_1543919 [Irpex lacteus]